MSSILDPLDMPPLERPDWPRHKDGEYPILVAVQFDDTGRNALRHALYLALTHGHAPLHVAHVVADTSASGRASVLERHTSALDLGESELRAFAKECAGEQASRARYHVRMGEPVETLLQLALDYDVELLVVGTHARTGVQKIRYGSVAQRLIEQARVPVLMAVPRDFSGMSPTLIPDPPRP